LIASICDPSIGFSLAGRRHCADHREFLRQVVLGKPLPGSRESMRTLPVK
jgi:hypothetical protein